MAVTTQIPEYKDPERWFRDLLDSFKDDPEFIAETLMLHADEKPRNDYDGD